MATGSPYRVSSNLDLKHMKPSRENWAPAHSTSTSFVNMGNSVNDSYLKDRNTRDHNRALLERDLNDMRARSRSPHYYEQVRYGQVEARYAVPERAVRVPVPAPHEVTVIKSFTHHQDAFLNELQAEVNELRMRQSDYKQLESQYNYLQEQYKSI